MRRAPTPRTQVRIPATAEKSQRQREKHTFSSQVPRDEATPPLHLQPHNSQKGYSRSQLEPWQANAKFILKNICSLSRTGKWTRDSSHLSHIFQMTYYWLMKLHGMNIRSSYCPVLAPLFVSLGNLNLSRMQSHVVQNKENQLYLQRNRKMLYVHTENLMCWFLLLSATDRQCRTASEALLRQR